MDQAIACFRQALALVPRYVEALLHLRDAIQESVVHGSSSTRSSEPPALAGGGAAQSPPPADAGGSLAEGIAAYRQLLSVKPDHADAAGKLALLLARQGRFGDWDEVFARVTAALAELAEAPRGPVEQAANAA